MLHTVIKKSPVCFDRSFYNGSISEGIQQAKSIDSGGTYFLSFQQESCQET